MPAFSPAWRAGRMTGRAEEDLADRGLEADTQLNQDVVYRISLLTQSDIEVNQGSKACRHHHDNSGDSSLPSSRPI